MMIIFDISVKNLFNSNNRVSEWTSCSSPLPPTSTRMLASGVVAPPEWRRSRPGTRCRVSERKFQENKNEKLQRRHCIAELWSCVERLITEGKVGGAGLSDLNPPTFFNIYEAAEIKPTSVQVNRIIRKRDSKQPPGCFSTRWIQNRQNLFEPKIKCIRLSQAHIIYLSQTHRLHIGGGQRH